MGFLSQWKMYLDQMPSSLNSEFKGKKLNPTVFEKVREYCVWSEVGFWLNWFFFFRGDVRGANSTTLRVDACSERRLETAFTGKICETQDVAEVNRNKHVDLFPVDSLSVIECCFSHSST
jgi:hypothetical protein